MANGPLVVYLNDGLGLPLSSTSFVQPGGAVTAVDMAWGDVDNDGQLELAVANGDWRFDQCGEYSFPFNGLAAQNVIYRVTHGQLVADPSLWPAQVISRHSTSLAWGDVDGDGDLDLAVGNSPETVGCPNPTVVDNGHNEIYLNQNGALEASTPITFGDGADHTLSLAWGDYDNDGDLDLATGNYKLAGGPGYDHIYQNQNGQLQSTSVWTSSVVGSTTSVAWGDLDNDGDLDLVTGWALFDEKVNIYQNDNGHLPTTSTYSLAVPFFYSLALADMDRDGDLDLAVGRDGAGSSIYPNESGTLQQTPSWSSGNNDFKTRVAWGDINGDGYPDLISSAAPQLPGTSSGIANKIYLNHQGMLSAVSWSSAEIERTYSLAVGDANGDGRVDVVFGNGIYNEGHLNRLYLNQGLREPLQTGPAPSVVLDTQSNFASTFGGQSSSQLAPANFYAVPGVRSQGTLPIRYTLTHPDGVPFRQVQGFYSPDGGGQWYPAVATSDTLTTGLASRSAFSAFKLDGVNDYVRLGNPLALNIVGEITLEAWVRVVVTNGLQNIIAHGYTLSPDREVFLRVGNGDYQIGSYNGATHFASAPIPSEDVGRWVHLAGSYDGTTWRLYRKGNLIPITTCTGSAMGDLYDRPENTEFIYDEAEWQAKCSQTLAEQTLGRNEWETMRLWYPSLVTPTQLLNGPSQMPFDLTTVTIFDPLTPTSTLADPTFYINYPNSAVSSSDARAYLLQSDNQGDWLINLGSPIGGQNRVAANGAEPSDRLCVFDPAREAFGCETIEFGDDQLQMKVEAAWSPVIQITPVNSETLRVNVSNVPTTGLTLQARLFPDLLYAPQPITLSLTSGIYSGTFVLTETGILNGHLQLWVEEAATETNPRRETLVAFSIGGNPGGAHAVGASRGSGGVGASRGSGGVGASRGSGGVGSYRAGGGSYRAGGGALRSGHAPLLSPDGQLIYFTAGNTEFITGSLFAVQSMASLPSLPPGRALVGSGYAIIASPGVTLPAGSVSVQYLSNDVTTAGAREADLSLYFYNGAQWQELPTTRDEYFNVLVATSQGPGLYAVFASVQIPLEALGWNLVAYPLADSQAVTTALQSLAGYYSLVYGYRASDMADPWEVYAPSGVPPYVNDLYQLEPGRGYWISATQVITWYLEPVPPSGLQGPAAPQMAPPPGTFYGEVVGETAAGQTVLAYINGNLCGQGVTQWFDGRIVYVADVVSTPGCGTPGARVQFTVAGQAMVPAGQWTNDALTFLTLIPAQQVYLPIIMR